MNQHHENEILEVIHKYYPHSEEYTPEKYPDNSSCSLLSQRCKKAENSNQKWLSFLSSVRDSKIFSRVDNNTMLMYQEPSYQASAILEVNSKYKLEYLINVSVILNCFYIYQRVLESNSPYPPYYITQYNYNLPAKQLDEPYHELKKIMNNFKDYLEVPYFIAFKRVNDIVIPNGQCYMPTVFKCLFNSSMQ